MTTQVKVLKNGNGLTVCLPADFQVSGDEVYVRRDEQHNIILSVEKTDGAESVKVIPEPSVSSEFLLIEHLADFHERALWLRSLFLAIQDDEDVEDGFQVHSLASIGSHLVDDWVDRIVMSRKEFDQLDGIR